VFPLNLYARVRFCCVHLARETAGAARTRSSLRPPFSRRDKRRCKPRADHAAGSRPHIQLSSPAHAGDPVFQRRQMIEPISRGVLDTRMRGYDDPFRFELSWRSQRRGDSHATLSVPHLEEASKHPSRRARAPAGPPHPMAHGIPPREPRNRSPCLDFRQPDFPLVT